VDRKAVEDARAAEAGEDAEESPGGLARQLWDQVAPIALAVAIALLIRATVIESYYVPSESMLPTLLIGDHVFVNKFVYGAKVPFTNVHLPGLRDPQRGEIVVFALGRKGSMQICPLDQCPDYPPEGFVKRIVGIPGDRVEYRGAALFVNGERVPWHDTSTTFRDEAGRDYQVFEEQLDGCKHEILENAILPGLSNAPFTVPDDHYYFLGDNRDNSNDSRAWGTVRRNDLKGPVIVNYWSWNNQGSWLSMLNPLTWLRLLWNEMRWDRIGMTHSCD
jgi:signal peptidase I